MASFCIAFLLLVLISKIDVSDSKRNLCKTPTGKEGTCINLFLCPELIKLMKNQHNEPGFAHMMQKYQCGGYEDEYPNICCPISKINNKLIPSEEECFRKIINDRIVGGHPAKIGDWPWIVRLGYGPTYGVKPEFNCGGSLITDRHVITAAHCVYGYEDELFMVCLVADISEDDGAVPVERIIKHMKYHEEYNETSIENDIAIIWLDRAVEFTDILHPICLPINPWIRYRDLVNEELYTAGWGNVYTNGPSSRELWQVQIPVVSNKDCKKALSSIDTAIDERVICAGHQKGGKDTCQGDSGGPLVYIMKNHIYLIGIVSYGHECGLPGYPGVYTRVTAFLDWIEKNIY